MKEKTKEAILELLRAIEDNIQTDEGEAPFIRQQYIASEIEELENAMDDEIIPDEPDKNVLPVEVKIGKFDTMLTTAMTKKFNVSISILDGSTYGGKIRIDGDMISIKEDVDDGDLTFIRKDVIVSITKTD